MRQLTIACVGYTQEEINSQFIHPSRIAHVEIPNYKSIRTPQHPRGVWFDLVIIKPGFQTNTKDGEFDQIMEVLRHNMVANVAGVGRFKTVEDIAKDNKDV